MANKEDGVVQVRLDVVRRLKFDLNALAEFEEKMGYSVNHLFLKVKNASAVSKEQAATIIGFREIRALLWAALLHENPDLTLRQAGDIASNGDGADVPQRLEELVSKLLEAYIVFQGPAAKKNFAEAKRKLLEEAERATMEGAGTGPASSE